jgi:hypothetical protein
MPNLMTFGQEPIMLCNVVYSVLWPDKLMDSHAAILREDLHPANAILRSNVERQLRCESAVSPHSVLGTFRP